MFIDVFFQSVGLLEIDFLLNIVKVIAVRICGKQFRMDLHALWHACKLKYFETRELIIFCLQHGRSCMSS